MVIPRYKCEVSEDEGGWGEKGAGEAGSFFMSDVERSHQSIMNTGFYNKVQMHMTVLYVQQLVCKNTLNTEISFTKLSIAELMFRVHY
jgi:hypothetical protein